VSDEVIYGHDRTAAALPRCRRLHIGALPISMISAE
jgi:hypothetical protein